MRILGLLFILAGLILCFSVLFFFAGLPTIGVGALLYIAGRNHQETVAESWLRRGVGWLVAVACVFCVMLFVDMLTPAKHAAAPAPTPAHQVTPAQQAWEHAHPAKAHKPAR